MEGLDHLFLLPERALAMGSARLQKDLAGLNFDGHMLHEAPMGNVWICKCALRARRDPNLYIPTRPYRGGVIEEIQS